MAWIAVSVQDKIKEIIVSRKMLLKSIHLYFRSTIFSLWLPLRSEKLSSQQDNASYHATKATKKYLNDKIIPLID